MSYLSHIEHRTPQQSVISQVEEQQALRAAIREQAIAQNWLDVRWGKLKEVIEKPEKKTMQNWKKG